MSESSEKIRCQSCGMPLLEESFVGTNADGSRTWEFCMFCFQKGAFTQPNQTLEEMIQSSIGFMSTRLSFSHEEAEKLSRDVIPKLKRWQRS